MNVKIEEQNLRFKISNKELKVLLAGQCLHSKTILFDKTFIVTIKPHGKSSIMEPKLNINKSQACLKLLVSPSSVQELFDLGQNRDGLMQEINGIFLTLQVDTKEACQT